MVTTFTDVIGSVLYILNTYVPDAYNGTRNGSYFFNEEQTVLFNKYMPKGQVTSDTNNTGNKGFGRIPNRDESFRINVHYFTKEGDIGSGLSIKNRELANYFVNQIKTQLFTHSGSLGCNDMSFDSVERSTYLPEQHTYVITLPVIFKVRRTS